MKVFKFGGASVKDALAVKNVISVLEKTRADNLVIVVSAMGKMTNALEEVVHCYVTKDQRLLESIEKVYQFHHRILLGLYDHEKYPVFEKVRLLIKDMQTTLERNKSTRYDFIYDQIVCYGELISSTILSEYLNERGFMNTWFDARKVIKTNNVYREATVDWKQTQRFIKEQINCSATTITQGFIASDPDNFTTTLGREGSDYTAAIFAYCLDAEDVTIWKDVAGVLNGDPKEFQNTQLLKQISYEEAIELAFYGASVIHPKTLQPLKRKEIPLYVKSFLDPEKGGTSVKNGQLLEPYVPCYIVKKNQILLSLSSLDFSFIIEDNISEIFRLFHEYQLKVDLIQNSAISFSVCLDDKFQNFEDLLIQLRAKFKVKYNTNVSLYTIRHFNENAIQNMEADRDILVRQRTKETYQIVSK